MALPKPESPLDDSCSVVYNNTLYTYTSEAFQSLELEQGAEWTNLKMGASVTGGVCVKVTPASGSSSLWIVGGTSNSTGLERYAFDDGTWSTITPTSLVAQNRTWHSAVYLNGSDSILMYSGSQDGSMSPSTQTFTIEASKPYGVLSYQSFAPPGVQPLLLPWTADSAIYLGGSETNTQVMEFTPATSWVSSNSTLATPLYSTSAIKAVIMSGDDGSKSLYTFDMTISPNAVNRTVLVNGSGLPVQNAVAIVSTSSSTETAKRAELTETDWPSYNGTLAPTSTRSSYSLAMNTDGQVVISGGNTDDPLCIFQGQKNAWVNATSMLVKASTQTVLHPSLSPSSTSDANPTSTSSTSSSSSAVPSDQGENDFPVKVLGAVLGSIIGAALLLILMLVLFRWRRKRKAFQEAGHQRRASGYPVEKDGLDFADRGLPSAMHSSRQMPQHGPSASAGSFSSMAILMGRVGHRRGDDEKGNGSAGSEASSQFNQNYKTAVNNPIPLQPSFAQQSMAKEAKEVSFGQDTATPRPRNSARARRGSTRRSSGWNRYWSGGSAMTNFLGLGSKRDTMVSASDTSSHYSDPRLTTNGNEQRLPSQTNTKSTLVLPLKIPTEAGLYRVASGSPTIGTAASSHFPISPGMSAQIEGDRHASYLSNASSYDSRNDAYSSGVPESVRDQDPESWAYGKHDWGHNRPSNAYTASVYTTANRDTANPFPYPEPPQPSRQAPPTFSSDMSWLNLGSNNNRI